MSCAVGIDFSSHTIDLVRLDENLDRAEWHRADLSGKTSFDRTRQVAAAMPSASFYEDVYLVAIEKPMGFSSRLGQSVLMRIQGAVLAAVPRDVEVWEVRPDEWKKPLGLKAKQKPALDLYERLTLAGIEVAERWSQDALDALGIALYARDTNAAGVTASLAAPAAPYPFCRHPIKCAGRSSCPEERACND